MGFINNYYARFSDTISLATETVSKGFQILVCTDDFIEDAAFRAALAKNVGLGIAHCLPITTVLMNISAHPESRDYFSDRTITVLQNIGTIGTVLVVSLMIRNYQKYQECIQLAPEQPN